MDWLNDFLEALAITADAITQIWENEPFILIHLSTGLNGQEVSQLRSLYQQ